MLIFETNLEIICETKKFLRSKFVVKGLCEAKVIQGIRIGTSLNGLKHFQEHYVQKILREFECFDCKLVATS